MEGKLSTEDDDSSSNPTRRRVLKASAALSATGVVGSAAGKLRPSSLDTQCDGTVVSNQGTVGDGCDLRPDTVDSITIGTVVVPFEIWGWIDVHDKPRGAGPFNEEFKAGDPVGASTYLQKETPIRL